MESASVPQAKQGSALKWVGIGCGVLLLLSICCVLVVGVVYLSGGLQTVIAALGLGGKAQAAMYAPIESPIFFSMDLDLRQAVNFQKVWSIYEKSAQTKTSLDDFKKQFRDGTGCDFDTDIAPWWGPDIAFFLTDASDLANAAESSATPTSFVMAVGTRDQAKATAALPKCLSKNEPRSEETYKGTKITVYDTGSAAAVVQNYVMLGGSAKALRAAIDAAGSSANLAQSANFKNMMARLPSSRVASFYMDFAPFLTAYSQSGLGVQPQAVDQLKAYQTLGGSLGFTENGMRLDVAVTYNADKLPACTRQLMQQPANANQALKLVPANSLIFASGANIKGVWDCSLSQMDATTKAQMQDTFDSLKQEMGIDLEVDLLSWLTGEFAFAVTPAQPLTKGMPGLGVLVLAEAKDKNLVTAKTEKMAGALGVLGLQFQEQKIKGVSMKVGKFGAPTDPTAPTIGYGFVDSFFLLGGPLDALNSAADASKNPLANDSTFKAVQAALPAKNSGYLYASVSGLEKLIYDNLSGSNRTTYQKDVQPWLKPLKAIGWAGESGRTDMASASVFVYIQGE